MDKEYQAKVKEEKLNLDEKLVNLVQFITSHEFLALPADERKRLRKQYKAMVQYSEVLEDRIIHFPVNQ
jgi:hypothetical protein